MVNNNNGNTMITHVFGEMGGGPGTKNYNDPETYQDVRDIFHFISRRKKN